MRAVCDQGFCFGSKQESFSTECLSKEERASSNPANDENLKNPLFPLCPAGNGKSTWPSKFQNSAKTHTEAQNVKEIYGPAFYFQITCLCLLHFHIGFLRSSCVFLSCGNVIAKEVERGVSALLGLFLI